MILGRTAGESWGTSSLPVRIARTTSGVDFESININATPPKKNMVRHCSTLLLVPLDFPSGRFSPPFEKKHGDLGVKPKLTIVFPFLAFAVYERVSLLCLR